jgi:hypothetical protein
MDRSRWPLAALIAAALFSVGVPSMARSSHCGANHPHCRPTTAHRPIYKISRSTIVSGCEMLGNCPHHTGKLKGCKTDPYMPGCGNGGAPPPPPGNGPGGNGCQINPLAPGCGSGGASPPGG